MKTFKNSFIWKRGLCAAVAALMLALTGCSSKTPVEAGFIPGAAAGGNSSVTAKAPANKLAAGNIQIKEAPVFETTEPNAPAATEGEPEFSEAAAQYAMENGRTFYPIMDRDAFKEELKQESNRTVEDDPYHRLAFHKVGEDGEICYIDPAMRFGEIVPTGEDYLIEILRAEPVLVTEEAFRQAAQTGTIVLEGQEYVFTDSEALAQSWYDGIEGGWSEYADAEAWIFSEEDSKLYMAIRGDDGFSFCRAGGVDYLNSYKQVGWMMADTETAVKTGKEEFSVGDYQLLSENREPTAEKYDQLLMLTNKDQIVLLTVRASFAGKR